MSARKQPEPEINVTPLVDVVLVLLIIFMVIAPNLQQGVPVEMPEAKRADEKKLENPVEVVMTIDGDLFIEQTPMSAEALFVELERLRKEDESRPLVLKADQKLAYGRVKDLFGALQRTGFRNVALKVIARKGES
ncbi:MAG: biopolymer transporter ExbD [Polyangiaceae bacterium]